MSNDERFARAKLALKAIEVRLRFILILAATGLVIGKWETLKNHWERWTRSADCFPPRRSRTSACSARGRRTKRFSCACSRILSKRCVRTRT